MTLADLTLEAQLRHDGAGRQVFSGLEHGEIDIPAHLLITSNGIDIYDDIAGRGLLSIRGKGSKLILQAGNAIGLIPINDRVALEVNSRVPIANLERLLCLASGYTPATIDYLRDYGEVEDAARPILDFLTDALVAAVDTLRIEGLHKEYRRVIRQGSPSGRILPYQSAKAGRRGQLTAVSSHFERTTDTAANRQINAALQLLHGTYAGSVSRKNNFKRLNQLTTALAYFRQIPSERRIIPDPIGAQLARLPDARPALSRCVALSSIIIRSAGLEIRNSTGPVIANGLLIQMEDVFEQYVREILRQGLSATGSYSVLDGNLNPPSGASGSLFHHVLSKLGDSRSTPDTVICYENTPAIVIETKYKVCKGLPAREDMNQALMYGFSHKASKVVLTFPSYDDTQDIQAIGRVDNVTLYKSTIDLNNINPKHVEDKFSDQIKDLMSD